LVALADIMRLSLKKGAHSALSSAAWQEIRVRFGRDDKGEGSASMESGVGQKPFFITLGGPQAHDSSGRDDNSVAAKASYFSWKHGIQSLNRIVISTGAQRSGEICGSLLRFLRWLKFKAP
jgi:hypothetical protein